jgi:glucose-6-phosphate 1-dehydrogenase
MVLFGASGDLAKRKLILALHNLAKDGLLAEGFAVVGTSRTPMTDAAYRAKARTDLEAYATGPIDARVWAWLEERLYYVAGDASDARLHDTLKARLADIDRERATEGNRLYYLATAPDFFDTIVSGLGRAGLAREDHGWRRLVVEKPFGHDLESARTLNQGLLRVFAEHQIFRIDHYLGKETVQNILIFRFGNGIFEPIWNRRYIDHVQITAGETVGVEQRGEYYEQAGALRDMVPNHLFQLVTLTAMEPPISFGADAVRDEQTKVLAAIAPMSPEDVLHRTIRGQYGAGTVDGKHVPGYREEPKVAADSTTETYVALKLLVDNWRWAGVPFYLRTGKRLPRRATEISIQFRRAPFILFRDTPVERLPTNRLLLQIQPEERITLRFGAKVPGPRVRLGAVNMDFEYEDYFKAAPTTGYERLLYDCMIGDATLFRRADMVDAGWRVVAPIQDVWSALPPRDFPNYAAGTWGPARAPDLLKEEGDEWRECGT